MDAAAEPDVIERACPRCARPNPHDARYCAGCGHRFLGDDAEPEPMADPLVGRTLADRYRIEQMIGRGGMGVVYRVEHVRIGKLMAMKLLHGELSREKDVMRRFRREAEAASKLDHPSTVQVFDFGHADGLTYLVMELLGGKDLGAIVEHEGPLPFARVARIAAQIAGSVAQAHARGIVHRDLKPENVRVLHHEAGEGELVKVMDFGLAKLREHDDAAGASITRAGLIVGTPYYMAPEQIRGDGAEPRSDVYALGALMYKCLTGVPPFYAPTPVGVLTKHLTEPVVPPSARGPRRDLPPEADAIVLRALAKEPGDRPASMEALRDELLAWLRAEGEDTGAFAERATLPAIETDSGRRVQVATRSDVDRYERSLRAQSWALQAIGVAAIAAVIAGAAFAYRSASATVATTSRATSELEPNDGPAQASELPEGRELAGQLGRRMDAEHSDADVWSLDNAAGRGRAVAIDFSGLPNMDTVLEVFRAGQSEPLLVVDGAGIGGAERVPNLVLVDPRYFVRVREQWLPGRHPTENVSDAYRLRWSYVEPAPGDEREVNDTISLAEELPLGSARQGFVGWSGDADVFCVGADAPEALAILEPVPRLDLVLRVEERHLGTSRTIDASGASGGEQVALSDVRRGSTCLVISARDGEGAASSDPRERWSLRVMQGSRATP
ncbi:serine/threonine-protein kinase [Sandaracinus amylolyticus]|uniref:Serine/threonine protein kinase n=1 Tax=Sandaracinus amylolyticus TaxID=927083 RepID=A0A0F6YL58_9BACT|nr:serine/threonine-protein kinase [Sandaracinus amylolyticus]AKF07941.1 serine/threonine protein kinase [Sandaracinus amylolyticus]